MRSPLLMPAVFSLILISGLLRASAFTIPDGEELRMLRREGRSRAGQSFLAAGSNHMSNAFWSTGQDKHSSEDTSHRRRTYESAIPDDGKKTTKQYRGSKTRPSSSFDNRNYVDDDNNMYGGSSKKSMRKDEYKNRKEGQRDGYYSQNGHRGRNSDSTRRHLDGWISQRQGEDSSEGIRLRMAGNDIPRKSGKAFSDRQYRNYDSTSRQNYLNRRNIEESSRAGYRRRDMNYDYPYGNGFGEEQIYYYYYDPDVDSLSLGFNSHDRHEIKENQIADRDVMYEDNEDSASETSSEREDQPTERTKIVPEKLDSRESDEAKTSKDKIIIKSSVTSEENSVSTPKQFIEMSTNSKLNFLEESSNENEETIKDNQEERRKDTLTIATTASTSLNIQTQVSSRPDGRSESEERIDDILQNQVDDYQRMKPDIIAYRSSVVKRDKNETTALNGSENESTVLKTIPTETNATTIQQKIQREDEDRKYVTLRTTTISVPELKNIKESYDPVMRESIKELSPDLSNSTSTPNPYSTDVDDRNKDSLQEDTLDENKKNSYFYSKEPSDKGHNFKIAEESTTSFITFTHTENNITSPRKFNESEDIQFSSREHNEIRVKESTEYANRAASKNDIRKDERNPVDNHVSTNSSTDAGIVESKPEVLRNTTDSFLIDIASVEFDVNVQASKSVNEKIELESLQHVLTTSIPLINNITMSGKNIESHLTVQPNKEDPSEHKLTSTALPSTTQGHPNLSLNSSHSKDAKNEPYETETNKLNSAIEKIDDILEKNESDISSTTTQETLPTESDIPTTNHSLIITASKLKSVQDNVTEINDVTQTSSTKVPALNITDQSSMPHDRIPTPYKVNLNTSFDEINGIKEDKNATKVHVSAFHSKIKTKENITNERTNKSQDTSRLLSAQPPVQSAKRWSDVKIESKLKNTQASFSHFQSLSNSTNQTEKIQQFVSSTQNHEHLVNISAIPFRNVKGNESRSTNFQNVVNSSDPESDIFENDLQNPVVSFRNHKQNQTTFAMVDVQSLNISLQRNQTTIVDNETRGKGNETKFDTTVTRNIITEDSDQNKIKVFLKNDSIENSEKSQNGTNYNDSKPGIHIQMDNKPRNHTNDIDSKPGSHIQMHEKSRNHTNYTDSKPVSHIQMNDKSYNDANATDSTPGSHTTSNILENFGINKTSDLDDSLDEMIKIRVPSSTMQVSEEKVKRSDNGANHSTVLVVQNISNVDMNENGNSSIVTEPINTNASIPIHSEPNQMVSTSIKPDKTIVLSAAASIDKSDERKSKIQFSQSVNKTVMKSPLQKSHGINDITKSFNITDAPTKTIQRNTSIIPIEHQQRGQESMVQGDWKSILTSNSTPKSEVNVMESNISSSPVVAHTIYRHPIISSSAYKALPNNASVVEDMLKELKSSVSTERLSKVNVSVSSERLSDSNSSSTKDNISEVNSTISSYILSEKSSNASNIDLLNVDSSFTKTLSDLESNKTENGLPEFNSTIVVLSLQNVLRNDHNTTLDSDSQNPDPFSDIKIDYSSKNNASRDNNTALGQISSETNDEGTDTPATIPNKLPLPAISRRVKAFNGTDYEEIEIPETSAYMIQDFSLKMADYVKPETVHSVNADTLVLNSKDNSTALNECSPGQTSSSCPGLPLPPPPPPRSIAAMSAVLTSHFGPTKEKIIPFDLELLDLANNYDNTTGMFICTIPGTYVISVYLMSHPGAKVNARVFINNRPVAALWADDSKNAGFYPSSSIQTIVQLGFGDQVYVMLVDGGYGESWVHANYNVFTIFLLYEQVFK